MGETETTLPESFRTKLGKSLITKGHQLQEMSKERVPLKKAAVVLGVVGVTEMAISVGATLNSDQLSSLGEQLSLLGEHGGASLLYTKSAEAMDLASRTSFVIASQLAAITGIELTNQSLTDAYVYKDKSIPTSTHVLPALGNIFVRFGEQLRLKP